MENKMKNYFAEIRFDYGEGYLEESNERVELVEDMNLTIALNKKQYPKAIRIDPSNDAVLLKWKGIKVTTSTGVHELLLNDITTNAQLFSEDELLFNNDDPQILITLPKEETWEQIEVNYQIIILDYRKVEPYFQKYKEKSEQEIKKLEFTINEQTGLLHECAKLASVMKENEKNYNETLQHYILKLSYIENSRLYKLLLKKRIDKLKL